jgi:hypothetical protein
MQGCLYTKKINTLINTLGSKIPYKPPIMVDFSAVF